MTPALHAIAQSMALRAVDSLIEGSFVGVFATVVLRAARRHNAGVRFAVSFSALMAIAVVPFMSGSSHAGASSAGHAAITVSESWALYLFVAWIVMAGFFLLRLVKALWHMHALRQTCEPVDTRELDSLLQETLRRHAGHRDFVFCTSDEVRVPTAMGLWKPAIVIPRWILQELSAAGVNQILLHEIAHLRRWDDWTNLAQQLVRAVFFFHPAVWWIEKRVALEREMACDDAVLAETSSPRAYAECLAHLAEKSFVRRSVVLAQAALGKVRQTSLRVAQILSLDRPASSHSWRPAASLVAGFAVVCAVGAARAPRLIAFQDGSPNYVAAVTARSTQFSGTTGADRTAAPAVPAIARSTMELPRVPVVQARFKTNVLRHGLRVHALAVAAHRSTSKPEALSLVHLAREKAQPAPMIETMFVVIETQDNAAGDNSQAAPQVYQIQMWRVLILHPAVDSEVKPPQKQT